MDEGATVDVRETVGPHRDPDVADPTTRSGGTRSGRLFARILRSPKTWGLLAIVAVALALRLPAVHFGLPGLLHPDEPTNVRVGAAMVDHNSWNPHWWSYPSLSLYVIAVVGRLQRLVGGWVPNGGMVLQNMGIGYTTDPHLFVALRLVTVVASVATCVLVWSVCLFITRRWWAATMAGMLLAVSPLMVENGVYITPDTYSAAFSAAALLGAILILRRGRVVDYALAGAMVGLAAGSKYNAVMAAVPVVVAHFVRYSVEPSRYFSENRWQPVCRRVAKDGLALVMAGAAAVMAFLITTPSAITNTSEFIKQAEAQARMYSTGHAGITGSSFRFYISTFQHQGVLFVVLAVLAVVGLAGQWWREWIVLAAFTVSYMWLISVQVVHFDRDFLLVLVGAASLSGVGMATVAERVRPLLKTRQFRQTTGALASVAVVALFASPILASSRLPSTLNDHPLAEAQQWIDQHVPPGALVVVEPYGPRIDGTRYRVQEATWFVVSKPLSKLPPAPEAIILTEKGSGRYLAQPKRYPGQLTEYHHLLAGMCGGAYFHDGPWVQVLTSCPRPGDL